MLAAGFWRRAAERVGSRAVLSDATLAALARYDWPGNVRELQNVLAALAVASPRRGIVGPSALPATLARMAAPPSGVTLEQARRVFETRFVRAALARAGGHRGRAAAELGVTRQGLAKLMGRLGVDAPEGCALTTERQPWARARAGEVGRYCIAGDWERTRSGCPGTAMPRRWPAIAVAHRPTPARVPRRPHPCAAGAEASSRHRAPRLSA